jgi:hypothetical protein
MNFIYLILFILTSNIVFCQITLEKLILINDMTKDQFETFSLKNGFEFYEFVSDAKSSGIRYSKGENANAKFLGHFENLFDLGPAVNYQTSNSKEFLLIKEELKQKEIFLTDSEDWSNNVDKCKKDNYSNRHLEITIVTISPNPNLDRNYITYQITLRKL